MNRAIVTLGTAGVLATAAVALAAVASAAPTGGANAQDAMAGLEAQGYSVQVNYSNGMPNVPLSQCTVSGVHGLSGTGPAGRPLSVAEVGTVFVDIDCPSTT